MMLLKVVCAVASVTTTAAASAAIDLQCPTQIFTDRGCTQKDYTTHKNISSLEACCALCFSLKNSTTSPCGAWTYHTSKRECETARFPTIVFGHDKISGSFLPTPAPPSPMPPTPPPSPTPPPKPPLGVQPNIVLVYQDDMDLYMGGWTPMNQTTELLSKSGATASNWFIHTPVCCPSRGEILSGRYFHNIRMPDSNGGCMHVDENKVNSVSYAHYLGQAGYTIGYFGKHLNNCPHLPPPGFDCETCQWFAYGGSGGLGGYINSTFSDFYGNVPASIDKYHKKSGSYQANTEGEFAGYTASIIANKSIAWMRKVAAMGKPFMLTVGNRAPHAPFTPAPWYDEGSEASAWINNLTAPRTPDYNASCPEFHWLVAHQPPLTMAEAAQTDSVFRNRWRALMSVDDGIAGIVNAVNDLGLGGKHNVYDHATRIPMVIKGPGIAPNSRFSFPASNVDVAPTLLGLAGADELSAHMDGRSIVPLIVKPDDLCVLPSTRAHIMRVKRAQKHHKEAMAGAGTAGMTSGTGAELKGKDGRPWRTFHPIEFWALNNHTWFGHLIDDVVSNSYRALRFVGDTFYGDLLYSEFTSVKDWHYELPECDHPLQGSCRMFELFNMTEDPHQLKNLYYTGAVSSDLKSSLQKLLLQHWKCSGETCP